MAGLSARAAAMPGRLKVIVSGGRNFRDRAFLFREMDRLHAERGFTELMQGGADGADALARIWALTHPEIIRRVCRAEWKRYGLAAGPIRNGRMLEWPPDLVVGFPGGDGTADMLAQARRAGVEVIEFRR